MLSVVVEGRGLHTGAPARVTLRARPGPVALQAGGEEVPVGALRVVGTVRAVTVEGASSLRVQTVDHLFAALAGLGVHQGLRIEVEGPELPLLDGASLAWVEALRGLGFGGGLGLSVPPAAERLRVQRPGVIEARASRFEFRPPARDGEVAVSVELTWPTPRLATGAKWGGDPADFAARIATARTFAFVEEVELLLARGLARHVPPESVVVLTAEGALTAGRPFAEDEPARHKLLDLLGDLYLHGGPPLGRVHASRPGHGATHEAMQAAKAEGIVG